MSERKMFFHRYNERIKILQKDYNIILSEGVKSILKILVEEVIDRESLFRTIENYESSIFPSLRKIISSMNEEPSEIDLELSKNIRFREVRFGRANKFLTSASFLSAIHKKFCNIPPFCRRK